MASFASIAERGATNDDDLVVISQTKRNNDDVLVVYGCWAHGARLA